MHIMRDDEYEPLRMRVQFGPISVDRLSQINHTNLPDRKHRPGAGRKAKFTEADRRRMALQARQESQAAVGQRWGVTEQYVYWCVRDMREGRL